MQKTDYPLWARDTIRYGDTDKQGHVNNAVFSTFLETGRVQFLLNSGRPIRAPGTNFVLARLVLDYKAEMLWPGEADIGTRVKSVGKSSFVLEQIVMQGDTVTAVAETVMVMVDEKTRKSCPLPEASVAALTALKNNI
ncbi:MAG: acyl-CoA thioesterase [Pseudolabrys sp.]|nr:acyl-CoA thioesterase [Pseudolabrys sp.]